jgi:hypothetical protein
MGRVGTHQSVGNKDGKLYCEDCGLEAEGHGELEDTPCS